VATTTHAPASWSAPAERSGDGAFELPWCVNTTAAPSMLVTAAWPESAIVSGLTLYLGALTYAHGPFARISKARK